MLLKKEEERRKLFIEFLVLLRSFSFLNTDRMSKNIPLNDEFIYYIMSPIT